MTDPSGGFYSAEDADSEGEEGTFYLWEPEQIASILDPDEARLFNAHYGVTQRGNFENNKTILSIVTPMEQLAEELHTDCVSVANTLAIARAKIFAARAKRVRPHRDDKVITGWNGRMISSLAYGGAVLQEIVIAGDADAADTRRMLELIRGRFLPNTVVLLHDEGKADPTLHEIIPFVKNQTAVGGKTTAYVCENYACKRPINDVREFESLLE